MRIAQVKVKESGVAGLNFVLFHGWDLDSAQQQVGLPPTPGSHRSSLLFFR